MCYQSREWAAIVKVIFRSSEMQAGPQKADRSCRRWLMSLGATLPSALCCLTAASQVQSQTRLKSQNLLPHCLHTSRTQQYIIT